VSNEGEEREWKRERRRKKEDEEEEEKEEDLLVNAEEEARVLFPCRVVRATATLPLSPLTLK